MLPKCKSSSATQRPSPKHTCTATSNEPSSQGRTQESLLTSRQTCQSTRTLNRQSEANSAGSHSSNPNPTTSSSSTLPTTSATSPPVPPSFSTQSTGMLMPHDVLCQLSNVLLQLTTTMQANAPLPHNIDSTANSDNSTLETDGTTDALSEALI